VPSGGYAANGNLLQIDDTVMGHWTYSYDGLNRVLSGQAGTSTQTGLAPLRRDKLEGFQQRDHGCPVVETADTHRPMPPFPPDEDMESLLARGNNQFRLHQFEPPETQMLSFVPRNDQDINTSNDVIGSRSHSGLSGILFKVMIRDQPP
jgi:hypothetical protein